MEKQLIEIIAQVLKIEKTELMTRYDDPSVWDSLHRIEILFAIEDEFDIAFSKEELKNLDTPYKLVTTAIGKAQ